MFGKIFLFCNIVYAVIALYVAGCGAMEDGANNLLKYIEKNKVGLACILAAAELIAVLLAWIIIATHKALLSIF